jgi:hypothetical protein
VYHEKQIMKTAGKRGHSAPENCLYLAVLVPHRDCLPALEEYRRSLFATGLSGAYSFPIATPLALLSRPLAGQELKAAAANMRSMLGEKKLAPGPAAESSAPGCSLRFFGPSLEVPPLSLPPEAVSSLWEKPLLAPAVLGPGDDTANLAGPPEFSFRAAALANLTLWPAECGEADYSFQWEIGRLFWLPKHCNG